MHGCLPGSLCVPLYWVYMLQHNYACVTCTCIAVPVHASTYRRLTISPVTDHVSQYDDVTLSDYSLLFIVSWWNWLINFCDLLRTSPLAKASGSARPHKRVAQQTVAVQFHVVAIDKYVLRHRLVESSAPLVDVNVSSHTNNVPCRVLSATTSTFSTTQQHQCLLADITCSFQATVIIPSMQLPSKSDPPQAYNFQATVILYSM